MLYKLCVGHVQGHPKTSHLSTQLRPEDKYNYIVGLLNKLITLVV